MCHSIRSRTALILIGGALLLFVSACGGGSNGGDALGGVGALQVLNNTGTDLADVEVWQSGAMVAEIGGGLAQGASWTFSNLPAGLYDVQAHPPGPGFVVILFYFDNTVVGGQTTNLTMTP